MHKTIFARFGYLLAVGLSTGMASGHAQELTRAELPPVKRIVLFNSGIAQVVRDGVVEGNQTVEIPFDEDSIDDVLKSIVFFDSSGNIRSVVYQPAPEKSDLAARALGPPMTMAQLMQSYRGESITLTLESTKVSGRIVGVENRNRDSEGIELVTILDDTGLSSWPLESIKSFQFDNAAVQEQLHLGMLGLSKARATDQKTLTLRFEGEGKRPIRLAYVIDAPIWRMTYRLDLGDQVSSLQGWAHVDNVSGNDWNRVQLDLRSGRPQSFNADIFAPLIAQRSRVGTSVFGIPRDLNFVKQSIETLLQRTRSDAQPTGGIFGSDMGGGKFGGGGGGFGGGMGGGFFGGADPGEAEPNLDISSSVQASAAQETASRMVRFVVDKPVDLESGKSAMIPVMTLQVQPKQVTRFDLTREIPTAELVAKFSNDSRFAMLAGPVAIYQDGNFVGDAKLPRTDLEDKIELVYGSDPSLSIEAKTDPGVRLINLVEFAPDSNDKNRLRWKGTRIEKRLITVENKDSAKRTILLKIKLDEATATPQPDEIEGGIASYLFEVDAASQFGKELVFSTAFEEFKTLPALTPEMIAAMNRDGATIADDVLTMANRMNQLNESINELVVQERAWSKQSGALKSEQTRLAGLIESLKDDATAKQTFVDNLVKSEIELSAVVGKMETIGTEIEKLRTELASLLNRDR